MFAVHAPSGGRLARLAGLTCATFLLFFLATTAGPAAGEQVRAAGSPRLDSRLARVVEAFQDAGIEGAAAIAARLDIHLQAQSVRVIVEARPGLSAGAAGAVRRLGAITEGSHEELVQALVPIASLETLALAGPVEFVRPPLRAVPMVTGEGVALINADDWQAQGISGSNVKVAVLDLGFQGYEALLGSELPASVTAVSFRADGDIGGGTAHGTAVAEIVHEVAPGAQLYLVNFDTEVELASASQWLTSQGVELINASWGYFVSGPGDGTGPVNDVVSTSIAAGTLWSVAAANHARRHWSGPFLDSDGDRWHEFRQSPQDEGNQITGGFFGYAFPGEVIGAELKWDDPFGAACRDYNLYLKRTDDTGAPVTVASSENAQNNGSGCVPGADPIESLTHTVEVTDAYHLTVQKSVAASDAFLHLYSFYHDLEYVVSANSLGQPADNANALSVGAVRWSSPNTIESFSSRGPTSDGRVKPDVAGPDGVSNATYTTGFFGTSAAAPHITGAAALVRGLLPCYTPAQLKAYLEASVVDLGDPGKDNTFGSGRLALGSPPADGDADGVYGDCDPCPANADCDGDGWTDGEEQYMGTLIMVACPATAAADDEDTDALPPDFNDTQNVDGFDIFLLAQRYGSTTGSTPSGKLPYSARYDLNADAAINSLDAFRLAQAFNTRCSLA